MTGLKETIKHQIRNLAFRNVSDEEPLLSSKILDSIIAVDLAVALEEEFKVTIPFTDINEENFDTVSRIEKYIQSKITA
jgi:acyl carrier protein